MAYQYFFRNEYDDAVSLFTQYSLYSRMC